MRRVSERLETDDDGLRLIATAHLLPGNDATVIDNREGVVTVDQGADMAWVLMNPLFVRRLHEERGWTDDQVRAWLVRLLTARNRPYLRGDCS